MHVVYCDTGAYSSALRDLEKGGYISVHQFMYENRSKKIKRTAIPSALRYIDLANYTYADFGNDELLKTLTYHELGQISAKYNEIVSIVGSQNRRDVQHLDSAFLTGCTVFVTSDKRDIWSKREALRAVLGITIYHLPIEWDAFVEHVKLSVAR